MEIQIVHSNDLVPAQQDEIISFCSRAYEEDMEPIFNTFLDPVHVLGFVDGVLICHALWITRHLQVGVQPVLRTAYIEAVATEESFRKRGYASAIMKRVVEEIQDFDLAALSPFSVDYYARLGWELWRGPLSIRTDQGLVSTPDEEVMIHRLPKTPPIHLDDPLSAEWRAGELW